jgi:hypothetical protein
MNYIYIFHIYILIIHYVMQLYNIRVWLASRAEPGSSAREMAEPSRAELGSFPALVPICKDDRILGILVLDVGGEHLLLPRHVVCASVVDNPA